MPLRDKEFAEEEGCTIADVSVKEINNFSALKESCSSKIFVYYNFWATRFNFSKIRRGGVWCGADGGTYYSWIFL